MQKSFRFTNAFACCSDLFNKAAKMFTKGLDNPYLELENASNGHNRRRY